MLILWKKKSKLCQIVYDEMSLNISCTLHDVTFLALCHLFYTLSLCNTFRFFSFPLYYFWWGVWYSRVLILGWLVVWLLGFFSNFHERLRTKLQNSVSAVWWGEVLGTLLEDGVPASAGVQACITLESWYNHVCSPDNFILFPIHCKSMHNLLSAAALESIILS